MPRLGQLLSALLVALIGVLVVQMFLIAGMQQRLTATERTPATDTVKLLAPVADPPPAVAPIASAIAPPRTSMLVIIVTAGDPAPAQPAPAPMLALPASTGSEPPASHDGGKALIERFIALTGTPLGTMPSTQEVAS